MFGAAVEDFTRGTIGPALGLPSASTPSTVNRGDGSFYASSYAAALAGGTSYRPKMKFLFKVEFVFTPEAVAQFPGILSGAKSQDFTFMVKSVDRPKIDFEYADDVNMYNFRTKVLTKIRHRELTITFMDDTGNRVLNFFRALMMIHSPITRRQMLREGGNEAMRRSIPDANSISTGNGMLFSAADKPTQNDNAIRGTVNSHVGGLIQTIRVKQMYVDSSETLGNAAKEVIFDFLNARLVSFDLDDLSHESSEVNIMTMQFDYDWMEIVTVGSLTTTDGPIYNITVPGINGAPGDTTPHGGASSTSGAGNPFANIITNQIGKAAQSITSSAINRAVSSIAGNGRFASLLGSQASSILGGVVGAASRSFASGAGQTMVSNGIEGIKNIITSPVNRVSTQVTDSAVGGSAPIEGITISGDPTHPYYNGTIIK
jgi:hypothetical protein